jgi:hypothetical protein
MDAIRDRTGRKGGQDPENLDITEIRESEDYTRRSVPGMGDTPLEMYEDRYLTGDIVVFDSDEETIVFTCSKETNLIEGFVLGYLYQS